MKITKEYIGRKIRHETWPLSDYFLVNYVSDDYIVGIYSDSTHESHYSNTSSRWELHHEPFIVDGREVQVGDKFRSEFWGNSEYFEVLEINGDRFLLKDEKGMRVEFGPEELKIRALKFYQEKKLRAPAIYKTAGGDEQFVSTKLFSDEESARNLWGNNFVKWPAIPNKDGFYEV